MKKTRYAIVGLGSRYKVFADAILGKYSSYCELVGLCDVNEGRLRKAVEEARRFTAEPIAAFTADRFEEMIEKTRPDYVIVTTKDSVHDLYICRSMELGCDVITEKPMTIDEHRCQRIIDTVRKTGRMCKVTFNYRYTPARTQIKDLLMQGVIGEVISVEFNWVLDVIHGADYFRRWHSHKAESGGLMVHKATHHFDLVNWLLDTVPERVFASGGRNFYTPQRAAAYGLTERADRCLECPSAEKCPFVMRLDKVKGLKELYLDNERYDGYLRDRCVFREDMDIEDNICVVVDYRSGARMSYSLIAFSPWEGFTLALNGTKGRLEHHCVERSHVMGDGTVPGEIRKEGTYTVIYPHRKDPYSVEVWTGEGGHGGADPEMVKYLFDPTQPPDKYGRPADYRAGAWSILTGIAANRSMERGTAVKISELVKGLEPPV